VAPNLGGSVVEEVDVDLDTVLRRRGANEGANVLGGATAPTNHATKISVSHTNLEDDDTVVIDGLYTYVVRIVDDRPHDVVEHLGGNDCLGHDEVYFFFLGLLVAMN
jgi:hypothetical protein